MAIANSVDYAYNEPSGTVNPITNTYNRAQVAGYSSVYARAFYNGDFYDSTKDGGDCANYESQCVWAGFGGDLTRCSINDTSYPFDYSGTYFWNQKSNGTGAGRAAWYGSLSLYNYANNSSSSSSENGWKAITGVAWTGATTKNIFPASNNYHGALFFVKGLDVDYGHTIFIMSASGNNPANMWYSAHTRDEYNRQLSTNETYLNNPIRYAIPTEYKIATSCTGTYTAHNYSAPPSGSYSAVCSRCGYVNMYMNFKWARYAPNSNVQIEVSEIRSNKCYEISAVVKREGQEVDSFIVNNSASLVKTSTNMKTKGLYRVYVTVKDKPGGITRNYEYSIRDADANE